MPAYLSTNSSMRHQCNGCGRTYRYSNGLAQHKKFECGKVPQFICPHCPYKAKQKGSLKSHIALKHTAKYAEILRAPHKEESL